MYLSPTYEAWSRKKKIVQVQHKSAKPKPPWYLLSWCLVTKVNSRSCLLLPVSRALCLPIRKHYSDQPNIKADRCKYSMGRRLPLSTRNIWNRTTLRAYWGFSSRRHRQRVHNGSLGYSCHLHTTRVRPFRGQALRWLPIKPETQSDQQKT